VSFVRGYCENHSKFVFRLEELDVPSLARAFGLVKLPKVDELRALKVRFEGAPGVDTGAIAYKDPVREAQRQARLAVDGEKMAAERAARDARRNRAFAIAAREASASGRPSAAAAAANGDGGVGGGEEEDARDAAAAAAGGAGNVERKRKRTHKGMQARVLDEFDLLAREERLEKRRRTGKISKAEFRRELILLHREQGIEASEDELVGILSASDGEGGGGRGARAARDEDDLLLDAAIKEVRAEKRKGAGAKKEVAPK